MIEGEVKSVIYQTRFKVMSKKTIPKKEKTSEAKRADAEELFLKVASKL